MLRKKMLLVGLLVGLMALSMPMAGMATFEINVGGNIVADNSSFDLNPAVNIINVQSGLNSFPTFAGIAATIDSSFTNTPGSASGGVLDLNWSVSSLGTTGSTLAISASANGYLFPAAGPGALLVSGIGGTAGAGTVTAQQWLNQSNTLFATTGITPGVQGPFGPGAFSNTMTASFTSVTPYSLTESLSVTVGANSMSTGDFNSTTTVPEPGILILLGMGLGAVGVLSRRIKLHG